MTQLLQNVGSLVDDVCSGERLVVDVEMESVTFDEVLESLDRHVDRKQFSVESTIPSFGVVKLLGEKNKGLSASVNELL